MRPAGEVQIMAEGRFLRLVRQGRWEYAERVTASGAAVLVAVTDANRLLLVEQYRIPCGCNVIELPAGIVGDEPDKAGESLAVAAGRELVEETGYEAGSIEVLVTGPTSAGLTSEQVTLVRARSLRRVGAGGGHGSEKIRVHEIPLESVEQWLRERIAQGVLVDPKVFAGLYFARR